MTTPPAIPFTRIPVSRRELEYLQEVLDARQLGGAGSFTRRCERWLEETVGSPRVLLTHSCTGALEAAAILANVGPGDEVIMPSFTFASTANAFVLRGAVPVFVDIDPQTFNIDPQLVAANVTPRTRAVVPVHYAGNSCDMDAILRIARERDLIVIEDAAQALLSTWRDRPLGSLGSLGALSFHQTKNVSAGEAGALLINDRELIERAEIVCEKGTNRARFFRGEVDRYTWIDTGSSYRPSELIAAFLLAQLEEAEATTVRRQQVWDRYHAALEPMETSGDLRRPAIRGNAHIYPILLASAEERDAALARFRARGIGAVFHYVPLHSAPAGLRFGRTPAPLPVTDHVSTHLLRLPLWPGMSEADVDRVVDELRSRR
jgi:dTDP-4-amino-4,6-dideoxygalactose transaminase